ncbi:MAG TPA: cytidine deaminase [Blastocatellia bacterium]|nr:cytidine deaminase [Blastocatellia bacterium]
MRKTMGRRRPKHSVARECEGKPMTDDELIEQAMHARQRAYAPYSGFAVGAAVLAASGRVITGCNVENASYGLTICAERVALFKALSEGIRDFRKLAVVTDTGELTFPCGACRQVLWEFSPDLVVIVANLRGERQTHLLRDLLPAPFDRHLLGEPGRE